MVVVVSRFMSNLKPTHCAELPSWVSYWALIASILVGFDCVYVFSVEYGSYTPSIIKSLWSWYGTSDVQYASSGQGIAESNGWMQTQSKFNVAEVILQLLFLFVLPRGSIEGLITILISSVATCWKTLIYMSIIYHSKDPVYMVPLLTCFGYQPLPENADSVALSMQQDDCRTQFFKFQFNFWWIIVPTFVVIVCWRKLAHICRIATAAKKS